MLESSGREEIKDQKFVRDAFKEDFSNKLFIRLVSKKRKFTNVNFRYSIFDAAYMRNCVFIDCDFTGCKFIASNLIGSSFSGCNFEYSHFERTAIDSDILDTSCPSWENLKLKFARTLRINFGQLGDAKAVNKAIKVELAATYEHLRDASFSNAAYYRKKYSGLNRLKSILHYIEFVTLDWLWGNGESLIKLGRASFIVLLLIAGFETGLSDDCATLKIFYDNVLRSPQIFLGTSKADFISEGGLTVIFFTRLVVFALFVSILVKRLNKR